MSWPWEEALHAMCPGASRLYTWSFAHSCAANCPYCFIKNAVAAQVAEGARWWTDDQAIAAWRNVHDSYGPGLLEMGGLEPGDQLGLVSRVVAYHYGLIQTNLLFDVEELKALIPPERLQLHPTFHPHLWGCEPGPFIERVADLQAAGFRVPLIALVGYPQYLPRMDEYVEAIRSVGAVANVAPMRAASYRGQPYPESYTEEELEILRRYIPGFYTEQGTFYPLEITRCGAGYASACVRLDGDVARCGQLRGMGGTQNLFRDGTIQFDAEPMPCDEETCRCAQFNMFWLED